MHTAPSQPRDPRPQPCVVRAGHSHGGAPVSVGPDRWMVNLPAAATGHALSVMSWHGHAPGGPPLHVHPEQDELFIVDEGEYRFQCGDGCFVLAAGDSIFLPRGLPHTFRQLGATGRLRFLYTPAGRMEEFFAALSRLQGPPAPEEAQTLFASHGMQVVGPPLTD